LRSAFSSSSSLTWARITSHFGCLRKFYAEGVSRAGGRYVRACNSATQANHQSKSHG
jgi:hypothetical protein